MNEQEKLIEALKVLFKLKNDAALANALNLAPPVLSKLRAGKLKITPVLLVKIHDTFNMPITQIRALYQSTEQV